MIAFDLKCVHGHSRLILDNNFRTIRKSLETHKKSIMYLNLLKTTYIFRHFYYCSAPSGRYCLSSRHINAATNANSLAPNISLLKLNFPGMGTQARLCTHTLSVFSSMVCWASMGTHRCWKHEWWRRRRQRRCTDKPICACMCVRAHALADDGHFNIT